jgi:branched-chain amino acid transport system permease protein
MFLARRYENLVYILFVILLLLLSPVIPKWIEFLIIIALIYAIAVLGLIPLSGLGGLISFGNGAFLTLSAYTVGLLIRYLKIDSLILLIIPAILIPVIVAWIFSLLALRARYIFFALITLAFTMLIYTLLLKFYVYTGGTDGLHIPNIALIKDILDLKVRDYILGRASTSYYITVITFAIILFITKRILNSPFALGLAALRDNERRAKDLGINPNTLYLYAFMYSALTASLSGILYAISVGHIDPGLAYWTGPSAKIVFIATLGGFTAPGSIIASFIYILLESYALKYLSYYWQFLMGSILLLILLTSPKGLSALFESLLKQFSKMQSLAHLKRYTQK